MNLSPPVSRRRSAAALAATGGLLVAAGLTAFGPAGAQASSHREAPLISGAPQYDTTDVYAFRSPERQRTVTLIANWIPFEEPAGGPNFYSFATDANYDINIDNDGDAKADIVLRWNFKDNYRNKKTFLYATGPVDSLNDPNLNYFQTYKLTAFKDGKRRVLVRNRKVAPSDVGKASMPDYEALRDEAVTNIGRGKGRLRSFAGQAEDPFFLDLRVFDLLYGGDLSQTGDDTLAGFNVNSVALQVPRHLLAKNRNVTRNPVIGIWSTTDRRGVRGMSQVSRLGMALVNEVVIPVGDKDKFNASRPRNDGQFLEYVTEPELPKLVEAIYGIDAPDEPRNDLVQVFLTGLPDLNQPKNVTPSEQLRLNLTTPVTENPDRLGAIAGDAQGYPNGRRLADDVIDISLRVAQGVLVPGHDPAADTLGDGVDVNDADFSEVFPYLALPARGSDPSPHDGAAATSRSSSSGGAGWLARFGDGGPILGSPLVAATSLGLGLVALMAGMVGLVRRPRRRVAPVTSGHSAA